LETSLAAEEAALLKYIRLKKQQRNVELLRKIKERVEAGDLTALDGALLGDSSAIQYRPAANAQLPRPVAPVVFTKASRQEYNSWVRDCERYFVEAPAQFPGDVQRVSFASGYLSDTLKTQWDGHCTLERTRDPTFAPTWAYLKERMLSTLGTPAERQRAAGARIKACHQKKDQTPSDLLDYLRPLWDETGRSDPDVWRQDFYLALLPDIRHDLEKLAYSEYDSLEKLEEKANALYRVQREMRQKHADHQERKDAGKRKNEAGDEDKEKSSGQPKKKNKKTTLDSSSITRPSGKEIKCFACGKVGHKRPDCPDNDKFKSELASGPKPQSGKGKGQKS
jgi:hypothetical protein